MYNVIAKEVDLIGLYFREQEKAAAQQRLPRRFAGFEVDENEGQARLQLPVQNLIQTINESTNYLDIGIIRGDQANGERGIIFIPKGNNKLCKTIKLDSSRLEPFAYPLLYCYGENGWGKECKPEVQLNQYIMSKILKGERIAIPSLLNPDYKLMMNRRQAMPRLAQVWVVDSVSRMIDMHLNFVRNNQSLIRGGEQPLYDASQQENNGGEEFALPVAPVQHVLCPASVTGSRRHLAGRAKEALAVASHIGGSTEFLTLTVNAKWREIQEVCGNGQTAFDRADAVAQVFQEKLKVLIANLKSGKYHGAKMVYIDIWDAELGIWVNDEVGKYVPHDANGESIMDYLVFVLEYQHRGLPHAHIVYRIKYAPEGPRRGDSPEEARVKEQKVVEWIDGKTVVTECDGRRTREVYYPSICAYRPGKPIIRANTPRTPDEEAQALVDDLIGECELHTCAVAENGCKNTPMSPCKRHFDKFVPNNRTTFDDRGRPVYRRPLDRDLKVVGHNPFILIDWGAHHNVESSTSVLSILYLYNYLFKGNKKVVARALLDPEHENEGVEAIDEIEIYVKGRLLCAHDAVNRGLGYETYPASQPSVSTIAVKTEAQVAFYTHKRTMCDMYVYMNTRHIYTLKDMTFEELFTLYYATYEKPTNTRLSRGEEFCYEIPSPSSKKLFVFKYLEKKTHIVRMEMLYPSVGDAWYLRLILQKRPIKNWKDARCWPPIDEEHSIEYANHQLAARAAGYLVGELFDEAFLCFGEAVVSQDRTPASMRGLFATLTLDGFVTGTFKYADNNS